MSVTSRKDPSRMTTKAACQLLGVTEYTLKRMAMTGRLSVIAEPGVPIRFRRAEVEKLAAELEAERSEAE